MGEAASETPPRRVGVLRVTQLAGNGSVTRDFDAAEWDHEWVGRGEFQTLMVNHTRDPEPSAFMEFAEFSCPVTIEFIAES